MDPESTPAEAGTVQETTPPEGQEPAQVEPEEAVQETKPPKTFDEKYVRELRKQAADARTRANESEARLKEIADRDKTEAERLAERATEAETRASEAESKLLRYEVAADRDLDLKAAGFLTGSTREEIEARADELAALLAERNETSKTLSLDGGARKTATKRGTPEEEHNDLLLQALGRPKT